MPQVFRSIGTNIKTLRKKSGLSQEALAKRVNLTRNYLSLVENNKKMPSMVSLAKIAHELNVTVSQLLDKEPLGNDLRRLIRQHGLKNILRQLKRLARY